LSLLANIPLSTTEALRSPQEKTSVISAIFSRLTSLRFILFVWILSISILVSGLSLSSKKCGIFSPFF
ncbi:MAG: hypothetical protein QXO75_08715, partial [Nitrososphaerota archaeon]